MNISLPPEVEKAIDQRSSMNAIGNLQQFQQFQMGNAMMAAAENPSGGGASEGVGLGMGFAMAGQMMGMGGMNQQTAAPAAPPPPPMNGPTFHVAVNGQTQGPFSLQQMAAGVSQGQINGETMVWSQGMAGWIPASPSCPAGILFCRSATTATTTCSWRAELNNGRSVIDRGYPKTS